jgi:hypothetical protein
MGSEGTGRGGSAGYRGDAQGGFSLAQRGRAERVQPGSEGTGRAGSDGFSSEGMHAHGGGREGTGRAGPAGFRGDAQGGFSRVQSVRAGRVSRAPSGRAGRFSRIQRGRAGRVQPGSEGTRRAGSAGYGGDGQGEFMWVQRVRTGRILPGTEGTRRAGPARLRGDAQLRPRSNYMPGSRGRPRAFLGLAPPVGLALELEQLRVCVDPLYLRFLRRCCFATGISVCRGRVEQGAHSCFFSEMGTHVVCAGTSRSETSGSEEHLPGDDPELVRAGDETNLGLQRPVASLLRRSKDDLSSKFTLSEGSW